MSHTILYIGLLTLCVIIKLSESQTLSHSETFNDGIDDFDLSITIDSTLTTVSMTGPSSNWVGIGFGSTTMTDAYVVAYGYESSSDVNETLFERYTTEHTTGTSISECNSDTCARLSSITEIDSRRTITFTRQNSVPPSSSYTYEFDNTVSSLSIIWGIGLGSTFTSHNDKQADGTTISFGSTSATTSAPGDTPTCGASSYGYAVQEIESGSDISIGVCMNTTKIIFELYGPSDRWFGVCWGGSEIHFGGDCLLYTTGLNDDDTESAYDYSLNGQTIGSTTQNSKDSSQDWFIHEITTTTQTYVKVSRLLDTGDSDDHTFSYADAANLEFYFAHGSSSSHEFAYHGSSKYDIAINLVTGTSSIVEETQFTTKDHGILMFIAFGVLLPWGALINRFLGLSICSNIEYLRDVGYLHIQLHRSIILIAWFLSIWGFLTQWTNSSTTMFNNRHSIVGFIWFLLFSLQVIGGYGLQFIGKLKSRQNGGDEKIILFHSIIGWIYVIFGLITVMTGIHAGYGQNSTWFRLFIINLVLLIIIFIILQVYGCINKNSMDRNKFDESIQLIASENIEGNQGAQQDQLRSQSQLEKPKVEMQVSDSEAPSTGTRQTYQ